MPKHPCQRWFIYLMNLLYLYHERYNIDQISCSSFSISAVLISLAIEVHSHSIKTRCRATPRTPPRWLQTTGIHHHQGLAVIAKLPQQKQRVMSRSLWPQQIPMAMTTKLTMRFEIPTLGAVTKTPSVWLFPVTSTQSSPANWMKVSLNEKWKTLFFHFHSIISG